MTIGEKKAYLIQYRVNEREIARLQEERIMWHSRAEKVTAGWNAVPCGGGTTEGGFPACVEKIVELERELSVALGRSVDLRVSILRAIASVPDARARLLLHLRYVDGLTWERVAEKMEITRQWVRLLHDRALKKI